MKRPVIFLLAVTFAVTMIGCNSNSVQVIDKVEPNEITDSSIDTKESTSSTVIAGYFEDNDFDTVEINEDGSAEIGIYRLTTFTNGKVTTNEDSITIDSLDGNGNPISFSFYKEGKSYTLKVTDSSWSLLEPGETFTGFMPGEKLED